MATYRFCAIRGCTTACPHVIDSKRYGHCELADTCDIMAEPEGEFTPSRAVLGDRPFQTPIAMYSIAPETPAQLADLRRKMPGVQLDDQLVPLARNRQEKKQILEAVGAEEHS